MIKTLQQQLNNNDSNNSNESNNDDICESRWALDIYSEG